MKHVAFKMKLHEGKIAEYKGRHDQIWPELVQLLREAGVYDYSIFLDEASHSLFGVLKLNDENSFHNLPQQEVMKRWWAYMKDIMETNDDNSPVAIPLQQVFYME